MLRQRKTRWSFYHYQCLSQAARIYARMLNALCTSSYSPVFSIPFNSRARPMNRCRIGVNSDFLSGFARMQIIADFAAPSYSAIASRSFPTLDTHWVNKNWLTRYARTKGATLCAPISVLRTRKRSLQVRRQRTPLTVFSIRLRKDQNVLEGAGQKPSCMLQCGDTPSPH